MRAIAAATRQRLRERLAASALGPSTLDFLDAVVLQVAHPLGGVRAGDSATHEQALADRVLILLEASLGGDESVVRAAGELATDLPLLSALFQNLDLLPPAGSTSADAIALLVVMALSRLEEAGEGG